MKKMKIWAISLCCIALTGCGNLGLGSGTTGNGQSGSVLGDILGGVLGSVTNGETIGNVLGSVIGLDKPKQADLIGTWKYRQPGVAFTSENLLAKAGGEVAATQAKEKLASVYQSVGIKSSNTAIQFNNDGTFAAVVCGKSLSGSYTYDEKECKITMKTLLFSLPAYAKRTSVGLSVLFESKKLLTLLQTVATLSGNSTLGTIGDLSKNYDGLRMGFDMNK